MSNPDQATTPGDAHQIRNMIRRGHRTSAGLQLVARWQPVATLKPGDVLAGLRAGGDFSSARAELERALNARTFADVLEVDGDDVETRISVATRMGLRFNREWRNVAQLPALALEPVSVNRPTSETSVSPNETD